MPVLEPISEIAGRPANKRSEAQATKLRRCFLDKYASSEVTQAHRELGNVRKQRDRFFDTIPR